MAEFKTVDELVDAANKVKTEGYKQTDAYSPYPVEGLTDALGHSLWLLPLVVLGGGLAGGLGGYMLQWFTSVYSYPLIVADRPFHSWPAFFPVTFECTILGASLSAVFGMFALNRLPMPYHPVFNVESFDKASRDRFFLCIRSIDPKYDAVETRKFLESLGPCEVQEVPE
ncbi:MAG: DUF3341 domain-containing protein [Planctomycetia bacterium]|nr:DUF3341 domain-containing protein [Planctomycetia bacterium]